MGEYNQYVMSKMNYRDLIAARKIKEEIFVCTAANLIDLVSKCHNAIVSFIFVRWRTMWLKIKMTTIKIFLNMIFLGATVVFGVTIFRVSLVCNWQRQDEEYGHHMVYSSRI